MDVREALEKMVTVDDYDCSMINADELAPIIETFGRACYYAGIDDKSERPNSDRGITAGVAAMVEES